MFAAAGGRDSFTMIRPRLFEVQCEPIDVTMMRRSDLSWIWTDSAGHVHRWVNETTGLPAAEYSPAHRYTLPSLLSVEDYPATEEYPAHSHWECRQCQETVYPGFCTDSNRQFIPGLREYFIDGTRVSEEEFYCEMKKDKIYFSSEPPSTLT